VARIKWPWAAVVGGLVAAAGAVMIVVLASAPLPQMPPQAQSSKLLAFDGQVVATFHGEENRTIVPLDQISKHVQVAVVSTEDRSFFKHNGFSVRGVARAARANWEDRRIVQGGSTISQQLVRSVFPQVGTDRTFSRKLKETLWALRLERFYSKAEILERYLNTVYFGRGSYGAEAAARTYFKIPASQLTIGQSAYLAGLIRAPHRYQIDENPEGALQLRNGVIRSMVRGGFIRPSEGDAALLEDLKAQFRPGMTIEVDSPRAGYFVEHVRRLLKTEFRLSDEEILRGGLQIHTTLDFRMQDAAEAAVRSVLDRPNDPEAALVAMDAHGHVRAMVGARDVDSIERARGYNFAEDVNHPGAGRPAGSAFKPFALAAFVADGKSLHSTFSGASTVTIRSEHCRNGDGTPWQVSNYGHAGYGYLDVISATTNSVNTIYAQMMDEVVKPEMFMDIAGKAGVDIPDYDKGCALTLGTTDVTPMEMARAFTTFAQRGRRPEPLVITKITKPNGEILAQRFHSANEMLDPNVADTVNYVLEENIRSGTGTGGRIGRPAAGKTGTTEDFKNAWFAGYTPELTAVVWMGYAPDAEGRIAGMTNVHGRTVPGGSFPTTIWQRFMSRALQGIKPSTFHAPELGGEIIDHRPPPPQVPPSPAWPPPGFPWEPVIPPIPRLVFPPCFPFCF
jgi:penicillin-binding protein 1A